MLSSSTSSTTFQHLQEYSRVASYYLPYVLPPIAFYGLYKLLCRLVPGPQNQVKLNLKDRTVLITGASGGLGRALAFEFYAKGAKVLLTARSIDKLQELCNELEEMGRERGWQNPHRPAYRYLDLSELNGIETDHYPQLEELRQLSIDGHTIDVLVNNAGISNRGSCRATPLNIQRRVMEVNYFGQIAVTRSLIDSIPDDGAILTISSLQGKYPVPYRCAYSASKHALQAFFDCLRSEERPNLQVLVVSAGYLNTGFGTRALDTQGRPMGYEDPNQLNGLAPDVAARRCISALENRETELFLAPLKYRLPIIMRIFAPRFLWWILYKRANKELDEIKRQSSS